MSNISLDIGKKPQLEWVPTVLIDVDHNYQRELRPRLVKKILEDFRWDRFGAVVLSQQENGRYNVTDGQHRVKAASLHTAIAAVPALIISAGNTAAEAANFLAINRDRQAVSAVEKYWAGIAANDPNCLAVKAVLDGAQCDVVPTAGAIGCNLTNAVSALQRAVARHGDKATISALQAIRAAWPNDQQALRGTLITRLARLFFYNADAIILDRVASVLRGMSHAQLTAAAEGFRKLSGGSAETALAKAITEVYNKGLTKTAIFVGAKK